MNPEPTEDQKQRVLATLYKRNEKHLYALVAVIHDTANLGPAAALENLADYLNGCDAVEEGDAEAYERALGRCTLARSAEPDADRIQAALAERIRTRPIDRLTFTTAARDLTGVVMEALRP